MNNYKAQGRHPALMDIKEWMLSNWPTQRQLDGDDGPSPSSENGRRRLEAVRRKTYIKSRELNMRWRKRLCTRTLLEEDEVIKATNTVVIMMEKALSRGERVQIRGFGDFHLKETSINDLPVKRIQFVPDPDWMHEINDPKDADDLGLKRSYKIKGGVLGRRAA